MTTLTHRLLSFVLWMSVSVAAICLISVVIDPAFQLEPGKRAFRTVVVMVLTGVAAAAIPRS